MNTTSRSARILIAHGDAPTQAGLRFVLTRAGFEVVAEARERDAAVEAAIAAAPGLALVSLDLPGGGIEAVRIIGERLPAVKIVVLSSRPGGEELVAAVLAGASGYLDAGMTLARLPDALEGVLAGEVALPRGHAAALLDALRFRNAGRAEIAARASSMPTHREWEVLELLATDASTPTIARVLGISEVTVRRHVSSLLAKLGAPDRASAADLIRRRPSG